MQTCAGSTDARTHVGVLRLRLANTTDAERYLGIALAEEISSALSCFRVVRVVSPSRLALFARHSDDEAAVRAACGVDFLVSGRIERSGDRLRIGLRLVDLRCGPRVIWADRFDRANGDLLSLLAEIPTTAAGQIIPQILLIESARTAGASLDGATAYDLVLRALPLMKRMDRAPFIEAGMYLARALLRDRGYAPAFTWYALWHMFLASQGWARDSDAAMGRAGELAARAVSLDPGDGFALTVSAHVNAFAHRHLTAAAALHDRALALNPTVGMALALSAITYACMGEPAEAERRYDQYRKFGPFAPSDTFFAGSSMLMHLLKRDYEAAAEVGRTATQLAPSLRAAYKPYLSALGHLGRVHETAYVRARLLSIEPDFSVDSYIATSPLVRECDRQHLAKGLRLAGVA